ncbi:MULTISPECIES: porin family protein [unclassified Arcicella]|uniref:type IX secretion/gliding motility protein PorT/SprT n=1 Tax=unclassified Arcicella TaxID=2644986 RepID=UPI00286AA034|nr:MULTISPECIES: porin family protein [unclassified Arcicella]
MLTTHFRNKYYLYRQKVILFVVIASVAMLNTINKAQAQRYDYKRIYDEFYDDKAVHFGFLFGFGSSRFNISHSANFKAPGDSAVTIVSPGNFSFQVGGLVNLKLNDRFDLKSGINIALYGRQLNYRFTNSPDFPPELRESTWLEVPILLKYKSMRRGNSRMYVDAGVKIGMETNVRKNANSTRKLDTRTADLSLEYGIGFEQFFKYFKFTPELRFSHGLTNLFIPPSVNNYARDIQGLNAHSVTLYLMFE